MKTEFCFSNFELLRILAMLGIVINHFFGYALHIYENNMEPFSIDVSMASNMILWSILECIKLLAVPSVNCFILCLSL